MNFKLLFFGVFLYGFAELQIKSQDYIKFSVQRASLKEIIHAHNGKVIYLDYWASWCKPCRKEILKMPPIKEHFKNKSVSFIYISVEGDKMKCIEAIEKDGIIEENYLIYQLINDTGYKELDEVSVLPKYYIFDKEGKLVSTDAPRPSQKNTLIKELNKFLEK